MIKQVGYVLARSALMGLLATTTGIFALSHSYHEAFSYDMSQEEQRKINLVSGDLILGGALKFGAIAFTLSLIAGGLELAYLIERNKVAMASYRQKIIDAKRRIIEDAPMSDQEVMEAWAIAQQPTDTTATT